MSGVTCKDCRFYNGDDEWGECLAPLPISIDFYEAFDVPGTFPWLAAAECKTFSAKDAEPCADS